ncbi:SDR family oxidoreductase [Xanthomonas hyacinthi]|nr:SDR family NAD(P)-dependent oxidoreductase [Xanthomonas hyacinthi]
MTDYQGKVAYITGAGSGIGRGLALAYARRGAALALVDVSKEGLAESEHLALAAGAPKVTTHVTDVSQWDQVERASTEALAAHGEIHFVCANAGVGFAGVPFTKATPKEIQWVFGVNSLGAFYTVRSLLPSMLAHGKPGHIVCTASVAALIAAPGWHIGFYAATKSAVSMMAQSMRDDIGDAPIGVSVVYPGLIDTNIGSNAARLRPDGGVKSQGVSGLDTTQGLSPDRAAEIILAGAQAGVRHIFTHPELSREEQERRHAEILEGIAASISINASGRTETRA